MASKSSEGAPQKEKEQTTGESIKDTIESILIAFVLAFVFRAFIVEAFVIPTGSMSTTLLGAHTRFICDDCGKPFTVNYKDREGGDDNNPPKTVAGADAECDNCGHQMERRNGVGVFFGDRILVLKYMYLLEDAHRWDVVVFKSPVDPQKNDYGQNYIKRLVGRPGEELMVLDGDIYVWKPADGKATNTSDTRNGQWEVQRKPRIVQDALWRVVYDNDYQPGHASETVSAPPGGVRPSSTQWVQPWQQPLPGGWKTTGGGRIFAFGGGDRSSLVFNKLANPQRNWKPFTDFLAYDYDYQKNGANRHPMSDGKVSLYYERQTGDGKLRISLSKLRDVFAAELARGEVRLLHLRLSGDIRPDRIPELALSDPQTLVDQALKDGTATVTEVGRKPLPATSEPIRIDLMNVDYQVTLRVNGVDLIQTTAEEYHPDVEELAARFKSRTANPRPDVWLSAEQQTCRISHLSLWRDIYYTTVSPWGTPESPVKLARRSDYAGAKDGLTPDIVGLTVEDKGGVLVDGVRRGSPASAAAPVDWRPRMIPRDPGISVPDNTDMAPRITPGSVITAVGDTKVGSAQELAAALKKYDGNQSVPIHARLGPSAPVEWQARDVTLLIPPLCAGDDEYFVCGDNSVLSLDARLWGDAYRINLLQNENLYIDSGRVPGRFMIGKAFFVYWPAGYRPVSDEFPGIIPNFGDMRFIH